MAQTSPVHTTQNLDCLFFFGVTRCLCAPRQCWVFFLFSPVHSVFNNMRPYGRPSQQYFCSISLRICIEYSGMWQESLCLEKQKQFCWCRRSAQSGRSQTCTLLSLLPMGILSPGAGVGVTDWQCQTVCWQFNSIDHLWSCKSICFLALLYLAV